MPLYSFSHQPNSKSAKKSFALLTALILMLTTACSSDTKQATIDEAAAPLAPTEQTVPADEAARREAWEAQVKLTRDVLSSMDRDELIGSDYTKGPTDADVVLLKFSDFECPYCAIAASNIKPFVAEHESDVLYIYKNFPLTNIHPEAMPAAKAAWAAGKQGKFWLYHDGLFAFQDKLGEDYYVSLAKEMGLDMEQFERDRNSPEAQATIDQDTKLAKALRYRAPPLSSSTNISFPVMPRPNSSTRQSPNSKPKFSRNQPHKFVRNPINKKSFFAIILIV